MKIEWRGEPRDEVAEMYAVCSREEIEHALSLPRANPLPSIARNKPTVRIGKS